MLYLVCVLRSISTTHVWFSRNLDRGHNVVPSVYLSPLLIIIFKLVFLENYGARDTDSRVVEPISSLRSVDGHAILSVQRLGSRESRARQKSLHPG